MPFLAILAAGFVLGLTFNAYMALALSLLIALACLIGAPHLGLGQAVISTCLCLTMLQVGYLTGALTLVAMPLRRMPNRN